MWKIIDLFSVMCSTGNEASLAMQNPESGERETALQRLEESEEAGWERDSRERQRSWADGEAWGCVRGAAAGETRV